MNPEQQRIAAMQARKERWRCWGPYLSERQWGTVREDYSRDGDAWNYLPHDLARSRAYRWGEDGLAGFCDELQRLCLGLALWNGRDPILKERLFGLTNTEGNHGEDVKELYYYLDATPTHSYQRMLYKYPQAAYPYALLLAENRRRTRREPEFELLDTGIFEGDRYFDVFVEYAKAGPDDVLMQITVCNRGPEAAALDVLPQLWYRNTWAWGRPLTQGTEAVSAAQPAHATLCLDAARHGGEAERPWLAAAPDGSIALHHGTLGAYRLRFEGAPELLFCENETNARRLWNEPAAAGYFKDAFHRYVIGGDRNAINPARRGTKAALRYRLNVPAGGETRLRLRLSAETEAAAEAAGAGFDTAAFDALLEQRRAEADSFYADVQAGIADPEERLIQRQAFAGLLWSKQFYYFDVRQWLEGDPAYPPPPSERRRARNHEWKHLNNADVISMPDKWEYPWYAAWDLGFHAIALALVDAAFAKHQLVLMTREWYMHPNGQLPAYEWNFSDVNPPVHAWAAWRVFELDRKQRRERQPNDPGDLAFLERIFHKLMLNFTWWVNRKDFNDRNIFQGGFLGLDNIGVFDRSKPLPTGGYINQSDGTSWMAMYSLNLLRIALELAQHDHVYEDIATKFFEHFLDIAEAMVAMGDDTELWNEEDGFFYDVLVPPSGESIPLKVRSMVGLIPLFAVETLEPELLARVPQFTARMDWYLANRPDLAALVSQWDVPGEGQRRLLSLLRGHRMKQLLRRMLDESEFLSEHGVRALSRYHLDHPYVFSWGGKAFAVEYDPAESPTGQFGGNSNWRGPVWFPVNYLIIEALQKFHYYYGDDFKIECPTGSGRMLTIDQIADELGRRLVALFRRRPDGTRPIFGASARLQNDARFRDYLLFSEYFDGDNGRGVGASHQTGWTALIAKLLMPRSPVALG